jgi:SSS family transporter
MDRLLTTLDLTVIALYILSITAIGLCFYQKNAGLKDFLLGGRSMSWLPVALSILAADTSVLTYLGQPAWVFAHDMKINQVVLGYLIAIPVLLLVFLPAYSRLQLYTAYQFLEHRFGLPTRLVTSGIFLFLRGSHTAIIIYVPALILTQLMGTPLAITILCVGLVTTFYTMLGGMKAVIWTDAIQVCTVLLGFTVIAITAIHGVPGTFAETVATALASHKLALFDWSRNFDRVDNTWACILGGTVIFSQSLTADQAVLQKYLTVKSLRETVKSLLCYGVAIIIISTLLSLLGVILFVFYQAHPSLLGGLTNLDALVPFYVATRLPHGLSGLVTASLFAGAMSTVSASLNGLATSSVVDIYQRTLRTDRTDAQYTMASRVATCGWGLLATFGALFAGRLGPLVIAFAKIQTELSGPLLGIFIMAVAGKRFNGTAAIIGAAVGLAGAILVSIYSSLSMFFYPAVGCAVTVAGGFLISIVFAPHEAEKGLGRP